MYTSKLSFRFLAVSLVASFALHGAVSSAAEPSRPRTDIVRSENPFGRDVKRPSKPRAEHETRKAPRAKVREGVQAPRQGTTTVEHVR